MSVPYAQQVDIEQIPYALEVNEILENKTYHENGLKKMYKELSEKPIIMYLPMSNIKVYKNNKLTIQIEDHVVLNILEILNDLNLEERKNNIFLGGDKILNKDILKYYTHYNQTYDEQDYYFIIAKNNRTIVSDTKMKATVMLRRKQTKFDKRCEMFEWRLLDAVEISSYN